jgi:hypothetical protein
MYILAYLLEIVQGQLGQVRSEFCGDKCNKTIQIAMRQENYDAVVLHYNAGNEWR